MGRLTVDSIWVRLVAYVFACVTATFGTFGSSFTTFAAAPEFIYRPDLTEVFQQRGVIGTFVLFSPADNEMVVVNSGRAAKRFYPASTFKVANSLIALETGAVRDENEIISYGGQPQPIKSWERDMSMRSAIRISNVPIYQQLATRIGSKRYVDWLKRLDYGNQAVGDDERTFWLEGPLKISAIEKVRFLARLAALELEASNKAQSIVADIVRIGRSGKQALYGKTGWANAPDPDIGWFVGWVKDENAVHAFALNMDIQTRSDGKLRKPLALELLRRLGVYGG